MLFQGNVKYPEENIFPSSSNGGLIILLLKAMFFGMRSNSIAELKPLREQRQINHWKCLRCKAGFNFQ